MLVCCDYIVINNIGRGAPSMGRISKKGRFIKSQEKFDQNTFTAPDLTGFTVSDDNIM
jgi:hypothetical protein